MSATRAVVASLISYLAIACVGGNAQALSSEADLAASPEYLFSVDVLLDESADPLSLGIRDGQTAAQAAAGFCHEQGFDQAVQEMLMPQLVQALEDRMAEKIGEVPPSSEESSPPHGFDRTHSTVDGEPVVGSTTDEPVLTLSISLDGEEKRTLFYFAGQDPVDVAVAFCTEHLPSPSPPEALTRCSDTLSANIVERVGDASGNQTEWERQERELAGGRENREQDPASPEPLLSVPLNINGRETALQIYPEAEAEGLASEFCRRDEFGLEGSSFDSCFSQIVEIANRAMAVRKPPGGKKLQERAQREPYTFKVPVTLAGLVLYAEFRTSETPRESARRFCGPNIPAIEAALGFAPREGDVKDGDAEGDDGQEGSIESDGRDSLKEACALVVENAINAVLLGLRERVLEAEMAQANATESGVSTDGSSQSQHLSVDGSRIDAGESPGGGHASLQTLADGTTV